MKILNVQVFIRFQNKFKLNELKNVNKLSKFFLFFLGESVLNFQNGKAYTYAYKTKSALFINDISDEAKSNIQLNTNVVVSSLGSCSYLLQLKDSSLTGESVSDPATVQDQLNNFNAVFRLNNQGELDSSMKFQPGQEDLAKNIKRAIVSSFQVKAYSELREA